MSKKQKKKNTPQPPTQTPVEKHRPFQTRLYSKEEDKSLMVYRGMDVEEVWYDLSDFPRREIENVFRHELWMIPMNELENVISIIEGTPEQPGIEGLCVMPFYYYDKNDPLTDCDCCKSGTDYLLQFPKSIIKKQYTYFTLICEEECDELYRIGFHDTFHSLFEEIVDEY